MTSCHDARPPAVPRIDSETPALPAPQTPRAPRAGRDRRAELERTCRPFAQPEPRAHDDAQSRVPARQLFSRERPPPESASGSSRSSSTGAAATVVAALTVDERHWSWPGGAFHSPQGGADMSSLSRHGPSLPDSRRRYDRAVGRNAYYSLHSHVTHTNLIPTQIPYNLSLNLAERFEQAALVVPRDPLEGRDVLEPLPGPAPIGS